MKMIVCFGLILLFLCSVKGQLPLPGTLLVEKATDTASVKKLSYSLTMGTSFISSSWAGKGSSYFISPEIYYHFSSRLNVSAGFVLNQNNYSIPFNFYNTDTKSVVVRSVPVPNENLFFASGNYQLSPRLILSGSVMTSFPSSDISQSDGWNNSFKLMSMGLTYRVSEKVTLNADMKIIQSNGLNFLPRTYNSLMDYGFYPY